MVKKSSFNFFNGFIRHPIKVGTIFPSSSKLAEIIADEVNGKIIVEFGAGSGEITGALLSRLPADGELYSFEINKNYFNRLNNNFHDSRFFPINDYAQNYLDYVKESIDCFVSGVPLKSIPIKERDSFFNLIDAPFIQYSYINRKKFLSKYFDFVKSISVKDDFPSTKILVCKSPKINNLK
ncbi:MAG: hypothetical protein AABW83_03665 [Nanoarchaeota archaeon]